MIGWIALINCNSLDFSVFTTNAQGDLSVQPACLIIRLLFWFASDSQQIERLQCYLSCHTSFGHYGRKYKCSMYIVHHSKRLNQFELIKASIRNKYIYISKHGNISSRRQNSSWMIPHSFELDFYWQRFQPPIPQALVPDMAFFIAWIENYLSSLDSFENGIHQNTTH